MAEVRVAIRSLTLAISEVVFVALMVSFVVRTWTASAGQPPDIPSVQQAAAGALAVALGGGYAALLGVPATATLKTKADLQRLLREQTWMVVGVLAYMLAGFAVCITYGLNEAETPGVLQTIGIGFGGYVIAFVGSTMRQLGD